MQDPLVKSGFDEMHYIMKMKQIDFLNLVRLTHVITLMIMTMMIAQQEEVVCSC